jgi:hypothetical protein
MDWSTCPCDRGLVAGRHSLAPIHLPGARASTKTLRRSSHVVSPVFWATIALTQQSCQGHFLFNKIHSDETPTVEPERWFPCKIAPMRNEWPKAANSTLLPAILSEMP